MEKPSDAHPSRAPSPAAALEPAGVLSGFTWRSLGLGLLLIPPNAYWVAQMERARLTAFPTVFSLFFNTVFILLVLSLLNRGLRRLSPRHALRPAELLLVYSMLCVSTAIAGIDFIQALMPLFTDSFMGATEANQWQTQLNPLLPTWLTVRNPTIYRGFYVGGTTFYQPRVVAAWAGPVLMWTLFIAALLLVMMGLVSLLRRRWLQEEHLACPLVALPVEISKPDASLLRSPIFWIGFAPAAALEIWNAFAFWYPSLPPIPNTEFNLIAHLHGQPWVALNPINRSFYPFLVGIGYLMPADFLFSCWFFNLFWKAERVLTLTFGLDQIPGFPFVYSQGFGAYLLFAVYGVWLGRGYFREMWKKLRGLPSRLLDETEPFSYRAALACVGLGLAFLVWFSLALGMTTPTSLAVLILYFLLSISITRMRAQFGAPIHDLHFSGPNTMLVKVFGGRAFSVGDRVGLGIDSWFNTIYRSHPMPHQMEALCMQDRTGGTNRGAGLALMLAGLAGAVFTFWSFLHIYYQLGEYAKAGRFNPWVINDLDGWVRNPKGPIWGVGPAIGVGFGFAWVLQTMRMQYINWPFHPLGFAIAGNLQMDHAVMSLLIAWVVKTVILKYGGHLTYRRATPFFLGSILADFTVISVMNLVCLAFHLPCLRFLD